MKALIYKDLFLLKRKGILFSMLVDILICIPVGLIFHNIYAAALILCLTYPVGATAFMAQTIEVDEKCDFNKIAISLPLTKNEIVLSKWMSSFLYLGIYLIVGLIFGFVHNGIYQYTSISMILLLWFVGVLIGLIMLSLNAVGFFLFGAKKGTYMYLVIVILSIIGYLGIYFGIDMNIFIEFKVPTLLFVGTVITFIVCFINYIITLKLYMRKYS